MAVINDVINAISSFMYSKLLIFILLGGGSIANAIVAAHADNAGVQHAGGENGLEFFARADVVRNDLGRFFVNGNVDSFAVTCDPHVGDFGREAENFSVCRVFEGLEHERLVAAEYPGTLQPATANNAR